jgi:hypothetical protein
MVHYTGGFLDHVLNKHRAAFEAVALACTLGAAELTFLANVVLSTFDGDFIVIRSTQGTVRAVAVTVEAVFSITLLAKLIIQPISIFTLDAVSFFAL